MDWSDETEQGFPPKRHKEPFSLRQDILDELSDHLTLAAEREVESGTNTDHEIRKNVLEKFGNPTAVARALWWDAMKGTIMKDWIQIIVNVVLCVGVMAFMSVFYRNMQSSNTALLGAINGLNTPLTEQQDPKVEFILHRGSEDGPPAEDVSVHISGAFFNADTSTLKNRSDEYGKSLFGPIAAGNHVVYILDPISGLNSRQSFTVYKGDGTKTVHIAIPPDTPTRLDTSMPFAGNTAIAPMRFVADLAIFWDHKGEVWTEDDINRRRVGRPEYNTLVTSEGIFRLHGEQIRNKIKAGEAITQAYGNRISLKFSSFLYSKSKENENDEWISFGGLENNARYQEDFNFSPGAPTVLSLNLSDSLLKAYHYNRRYGLNQNHGLPDSFGWFTSWVTSRYENYTIDSATLVEHSGQIFNFESKTSARHSSNSTTIMRRLEPEPGWQAQRYSLKNAPKSIPEGYKLLLGFGEGARGKVHSTDPVLNAYLDRLPESFDAFHESTVLDEPPAMDTPIWSADSAEIADYFGKITLFDLTDGFNALPDMNDYNGIIFNWDKPSKNELRFSIPEGANIDHQPVWILLKPYPEVAIQ